jgi:aspartate kinase
MGVVVQKYGGSSVETIEKMRQVADRICKRKALGDQMVVVVSAMGKTTNQLIEIAKKASVTPSKRELDLLMATGEQVSISLLTMILHELGQDAIALTGSQAGIKTSGVHTKNRIADINIDTINHYLNKGYVVVVAGFQGINANGDITTLGRGGSDTTAVALAAKLGCACEIYTDVEGIYRVDPRLYPNAKKIECIRYEEMEELACLGAKVMESRSVELGHYYQVPIYVASSTSEVRGSTIKEYEEQVEERSITGLSVNEDVLMVTLNHVPYSLKTIAALFNELASLSVNVDMISQTSPMDGLISLSFTTPTEDVDTVDQILSGLLQANPSIEVLKDQSIIKLSVVGVGMRNQAGIAAQIFKLFANNDIEFKQVTTSEISISYTINRGAKQKAVEIIAETFSL